MIFQLRLRKFEQLQNRENVAGMHTHKHLNQTLF